MKKKGVHGIPCDCWADSGTPSLCDLVLPNPQDFFSFFTKDKEGWTTPNILNLPCHSIAFGVSNTSITIGEYDHMVQSSPRLPYCLH